MKNMHKRWFEFFLALVVALVASACGRQEDDGMRGLFGMTVPNNGTLQQNSLTGLSCTATPSKTIVNSGETFQVQIRVYGATGPVSVSGATGSGDLFTLTTSYSNPYGEDVFWQPKLMAQDSTDNTSCSFRVYVRGSSVRRL